MSQKISVKNSNACLKEIIALRREELKEINELLHPTSIWGKLRNYGRIKPVMQMLVYDIDNRRLIKEIAIMKKYLEQE